MTTNRPIEIKLISGISGMLIFVILLGIANLLIPQINNFTFTTVVLFLNNNFILLLSISFLLLLGDISSSLIIPFNLIYPIFNAVGGSLTVFFLFRIFDLIDSLLNQNIFLIFAPFYQSVVIIVFFIVLIVGVVNVVSSHIQKNLLSKPQKTTAKKQKIEWKDVGEEVKGAAYNLASSIKKSLKPKKEKKKTKKNN